MLQLSHNKGSRPAPEMAVTGWHLLSGKPLDGSDAERIVTGAATPSGRQRTARRFAVGRGRRLGASSALDGYPDPPFAQNGAAPSPGRRDGGPIFLPSHLPRPIPATSGTEHGPSAMISRRTLLA